MARKEILFGRLCKNTPEYINQRFKPRANLMQDVFLSKGILIPEEEKTSPAVQYEIAGRKMK